jgi:UPF0042 nucleotide-binding protein
VATPSRKSPAAARRKRPAGSGKTELVIITGLSGSGKGTTLKALEDLGYYAVDNLPIDLFPKFAELAKDAPNGRRAALVVDIREGEALQQFPAMYEHVKGMVPVELLFLETDDETLLRRFSETRRPHPLGTDLPVGKSIERERELLGPIRELASHVINTSKLNVHELRKLVAEKFGEGRSEAQIRIDVRSFGYRHGLPAEGDLVFDVRFLPNPNYIPEFKDKTGRDPSVARYIRSFPQTIEFMDRITDLLLYLIPHYVREGKSYLTIAFGCTGGHHRSVMIAAEIRRRLAKAGYKAKETHRDIARH